MITGQLRSKIDKLWEEFWTGGITNPLTVIEQITFLIFVRLLDMRESRNIKKAEKLGTDYKSIFQGKEHLRWSAFKNNSADEMLKVVRDEVFPHFKEFSNHGSSLSIYFSDAQLMIQKPGLLVSAVNIIDELPLTRGDTKGDLYEYLLSKLTTAGVAGQFRTPRHIIELMVKIIDPQPTERITDPSCGTAGFLVGALDHIQKEHTSPEGVIVNDDGSKIYTGDLLENYRDKIQNELLTGFDFDFTMLRIGAMNLMLHGIDDPQIINQDTLSNSFEEHNPDFAEDAFDVVLANPPFTGAVDEENIDPNLTGKVKTRKTELLFLTLMLRLLKLGGRCASVVPQGVLFGSSKAHVALRKMLVEENQLEAVINMPSGVFKPYAGVATAIVIFTKGGLTDDVWFYDLENDGLSLDDKRRPIDKNDIPDCLDKWKKRNKAEDIDRSKKAFLVPVDELINNKYDLSINRYKEITYEEEEYEPSKSIIDTIRRLENDILLGVKEIEKNIED